MYQTLEDRGNPEFIEAEGPFACYWENTWLGDGFYFWDSFINNAHWWGKKRYKKVGYVICQATCDYDTTRCFDLVGEIDHLQMFYGHVTMMEQMQIVNEKTTVAQVLSFIKDHNADFIFEAVRVYGINSISERNSANKGFIFRMTFETGKYQFLDMRPPIQICIFQRDGLGLRNFQIIYPETYSDDYVI